MIEEKISIAEMAASTIANTGKSFSKGELVPVSLRLPSWMMSELDAMAAHSKQSRNQVINLVLAAGVEAVKLHLDASVLLKLEHLSEDSMTSSRALGRNVFGEV